MPDRMGVRNTRTKGDSMQASTMCGAALLAITALGCGPKPKPWDVITDRTLEYGLQVAPAGQTVDIDPVDTLVQLDFAGGGQVSVTANGAGLGTFAMDRTGRIAAPEGVLPPALNLLAIVPEDSGKLGSVGASWDVLFPSAAERQAAP